MPCDLSNHLLPVAMVANLNIARGRVLTLKRDTKKFILEKFLADMATSFNNVKEEISQT